MNIDYKQLEFLHPKLREVMAYAEDQSGVELTITSLYRLDDKGVHGTLPVRGCDLRMRNVAIAEAIRNAVNAYFTYDPERPVLKCALCHGAGKNYHLHLQVTDGTRSVG